MEAVMEHLIFVCPTTGREVDSGVESEIGTLLRIREQKIRAHCPACGESHEWPVRDAFLAKAA
jgi:transcription elongation factor Elf1